MKACPFCAESIQDAAIVCKHCSRNLYQPPMPVPIVIQGPAWRPGVAALLSLVIPGAGQLYKGQTMRGLVWLVAVPVGYVLLIVPGLILHLCCILSAASGPPISAR